MEKTYEGFFKRFKKSEKKVKEIEKVKKIPTKEDMQVCFLDLIDSGFNIIFDKDHIFIKKTRSPRKFKVDSVKETLLFAIPYLSEIYDFELKSITITHFSPYAKGVLARNPITNQMSLLPGKMDKTFNDIEPMFDFLENPNYVGAPNDSYWKIEKIDIVWSDVFSIVSF